MTLASSISDTTVGPSLTENIRVVIYDRNKSLIQATVVNVIKLFTAVSRVM
jgi:hypothetical protein